MDITIICVVTVLVLSFASWGIGYFSAPVQGAAPLRNILGLLTLVGIVVLVFLLVMVWRFGPVQHA